MKRVFVLQLLAGQQVKLDISLASVMAGHFRRVPKVTACDRPQKESLDSSQWQ